MGIWTSRCLWSDSTLSQAELSQRDPSIKKRSLEECTPEASLNGTRNGIPRSVLVLLFFLLEALDLVAQLRGPLVIFLFHGLLELALHALQL